MSSFSLALPWGGDPTVVGWLTLLAYLAAALLTWRVRAKLGASDQLRSERRFYTAVALLALLLGINKQADFQTTVADAARSLLAATELYEQRRVFQGVATVLVLAIGAALVVALLRLVLHAPRATERVLVGILMLFAFVAFRALLFAKLSWIGASSVLRAFELLGILVVMSGSWTRLRALSSASAGRESAR